MKLIAKQTIRADGVLYMPGQELPQNDIHRTAAWIKNGAAAQTKGDTPPKKPIKETQPLKDPAAEQQVDPPPAKAGKKKADGQG